MTIDEDNQIFGIWPDPPTPEAVKAAREGLDITPRMAGALIYKTGRAWRYYETGEREMDPALWEWWCRKARLLRKTTAAKPIAPKPGKPRAPKDAPAPKVTTFIEKAG